MTKSLIDLRKVRHLYVDAVDVQWQKVKMEHKGGFWILIQIRRFKIQFHLRDLKSKSKSKILWILQVQKSNPNNYDLGMGKINFVGLKLRTNIGHE